MEPLDIVLAALGAASEPANLFAAMAGLLIGIILGAIPGLNGTMAVALLVPLTFGWSPLFSIAILMGCWKGSIFGGSISAILLNTPGTPEAVPTARDGYPLARMGMARKALTMALVASVIGALISDLFLLVAAPPISAIALRFGPVEMASLILFALVVIAGSEGGSLLRGLVAVCLGLFLSMVGLDPIEAERRLTFGVVELDGGFELLSMMIGLLVLSEVFGQILGLGRDEHTESKPAVDGMVGREVDRLSWAEFRSTLGVIFRSSLLGSFFGALPGVGSVTAAFFGYDQARLSSGHPETFGKGELKGVAAPEAANNAVCGTALIPMVTLGIPGALSVAVIMGAFMIHGLVPGPRLIVDEPVFVYSLFFLLIISDLMLLFLALPLFPLAMKLARLPRVWLLPPIALFCLFGAYVPQQSLFDVQAMVAFGLLGFILKHYEISPAALLIAFILGSLMENNARIGLAISGGDWAIFLGSPISVLFLVLSVAATVWLGLRRRKSFDLTTE